METAFDWYQKLKKPSFAPPSNVFGIAWGILYPIIFVSFGFVFFKVAKKEIPPRVALPFIINLVTNLIFTYIQFGLKSNFLAAIDITIVVFTLVWGMMAIYPFYKWVTYAQVPYLAWGLFATLLQFTITYLNR